MSINRNDNQSDFGGREADTVVDENSFHGNKHHTTEVRTSNGVPKVRTSIGGGKVRESFAATLWNPMKDFDKDTFNRRRLLQLFSGVLIACCGGASFAFGIFSNKIKETAHFTQAEMTTITTAASVLGSFSFPAGVLFDHYGPQYVLMCATVLCCTGFGLLALIFEGRVEATMYSVAASKAITSLGVAFTEHFNFIFTSGIAAAILLNRLMFGEWFDREMADHPAPDGVNCAGYTCFSDSCYVIGGLCGGAVFVTSYIVWNWWNVRKTF